MKPVWTPPRMLAAALATALALLPMTRPFGGVLWFWPTGVSVWLAAAAWAMLWPPPENDPMPAERIDPATGKKQKPPPTAPRLMRVGLLRNLARLRLSPAPSEAPRLQDELRKWSEQAAASRPPAGSDEGMAEDWIMSESGMPMPGPAGGDQRSQRPKAPYTRWRPVSLPTLAALCLAAATAAVDLLLWQAAEAYLPIGRPRTVAYHPAVSLASLPFVWAVVHSFCDARRQMQSRRPVGDSFQRDDFAADHPRPVPVVPTSRPERAWLLGAAVAGLLPAGLLAAGLALYYIAPMERPALFASAIAALGLVTTVAAAAVCAERIAAGQWDEWTARREEIDLWAKFWLNLPGAERCPYYMKQELKPDDADGEPDFSITTFQMGTGRVFADYEKSAERMPTHFGGACTMALIEPTYKTPGTSSSAMTFRVSKSETDLGPMPHTNHGLHPQTFEFAVKHAFLGATRALKLGTPVLMEAEQATSKRSGRHIFHTAWAVPADKTLDQYLAATLKLQEKMNVDWLRVFIDDASSAYIRVFYGAKPAECDFTRLGKGRIAERRTLEADCDWFFAVNGLVGAGGRAPRLIDMPDDPDAAALGLKLLTFSLPAGFDPGLIPPKLTAMKASSGWAHAVPAPTADGEPTEYRMVLGASDPLANTYPFKDYEADLLQKPEPGRPRVDWLVGMGIDGKLVKDTWDGEEAHLLVAGASGWGKSAVINSLLVQLLHNNDPSDVNLWMIEPKNELQAFQHCAHVKYFIDNLSSDISPYEAAAILVELAVAEMENRNAAMVQHPSQPQKLVEARQIAASDPDHSGHLMLPYLFLMIEECSSVFSPPAQKKEKPYYDRLMHAATDLSRKGRSAGIHLVIATQYPTNAGIGSQAIKQQCRRLGMHTQDAMASRVVLGRNGLEKVQHKGRGFMGTEKLQGEFRGFFMDRPAEGSSATVDERAELIARLPKDDVWPKLPPGIPPKTFAAKAPARGAAPAAAADAQATATHDPELEELAAYAESR